jgi:CIC family chloride channel protein
MDLRHRLLSRLTRLRAWLRDHEHSEYGLTLFYSIIIGLAAGLLGAFFHRLMWGFQFLFFQTSEEGFSRLPWAVLLLVPILGGVMQAMLAHFFPEVASRKGVVEVMKSLKQRDGLIEPRTTLFHFIAPALNIGTGGSVGPEGPAVQFGAGVASWLGQFFHVSQARMKVMVAAGAGAAISAMFNAPLGGVFFTLEIILLNDLKDVTFGVLIMASVVANVVSHTLTGNHEVFLIPAFQVPGAAMLPWFLLLGAAGGVVSVAFSRWSSLLAKVVWGRLRPWPRWVFPPLSGLILGLVAMRLPLVLGVGYHGINQLLAGELPLLLALGLLALKVLLTALNIELGGFGGIIAPSLFMGAMLGGALGQGMAQLQIFNDPVIFILTGMGTVLAGINGIPLTAFLLLIEMTGNYDMTLPLMVSVSACTLMIQLLVGDRSLYLYKLRKANLLDESDPARELNERRAEELLDERRPLVPASSSLEEILPAFMEHDLKDLVAVDEQGRVVGMVNFADLRFIIGQESALAIIRTREVAEVAPKVTPSTSLGDLKEAFDHVAFDYLPVLDDEGRPLGIVCRTKVSQCLDRVLRSRQLLRQQNRWVFK